MSILRLSSLFILLFSSPFAYSQKAESILRIEFHKSGLGVTLPPPGAAAAPAPEPQNITLLDLRSNGELKFRANLEANGITSITNVNIHYIKHKLQAVKPTFKYLSKSLSIAPDSDHYEASMFIGSKRAYIITNIPPLYSTSKDWWNDTCTPELRTKWHHLIETILNILAIDSNQTRDLTSPSTTPPSAARTQPLRGWSGYVGR